MGALSPLCRQVLEGPRDVGRSSYQTALTACEHCRRGRQQGRGELVEVAPEIVAMAACDTVTPTWARAESDAQDEMGWLAIG